MPHQVEMLRHLRARRHSAIFAEMRTGKTLPTVRFARRIRPLRSTIRCLVVAPNSALPSWERELHLEGEDDVAYLLGTREKRLEALRAGHRWNLINKEGYRVLPEIANRPRCGACKGTGRTPRSTPREACASCAGHGYLPADEQDVLWDVVVVDESTFIKNPRAQVTRFFMSAFRDAGHRVVLTGTPNPESDLDLWSQIAFLHGKAFGCSSYWHFRAKHFHQTESLDWQPDPPTLGIMRAELDRVAFTCTRRDANMPDQKVRETRRLDLPARLRKAYDAAEQDFTLEWDDEEIDRTVCAGVRWHWMRQMCGGFVDNNLVWDGKIRELLSLLRGELAREQVVVWYAYNREIEISEKRLLSAGVSCTIVRGDVVPTERRARMDAFSKGEVRVLLAQQMVAEFGADLSAADTAIAYSRHPSLQTNLQADDRIVHPRKDWPMLHVDLVVGGTVDEDVSALVTAKRWRSQKLFDKAVGERVRARRC